MVSFGVRRAALVALLAGGVCAPSIAQEDVYQGASVIAVAGGKLTSDRRQGALGAGEKLMHTETLTLDAGAAVLRFADYGKLMVRGPARFQATAGSIELKQGGLLAVLESSRYGFAINTAAAMINPKYGEGMTAYVEALAPGTYVCDCDGRAEYSAPVAGARSKPFGSSKPHQGYTLKRSGKGLVVEPVKPVAKPGKKVEPYHHSDETIARLR